jgi:hypothetical protein
MEKETIEEAADLWATDTKNVHPADSFIAKQSFIKGAKWQAERMGLMEIELRHTKTLLASCEKALEDRDKQAERGYSEEEVLELIWKYETRQTSMVGYSNVKKWFEKHKKK